MVEFQNNSSFISTESHTLAHYFSKSSSFSRVCHKPVWLTSDLSVVVNCISIKPSHVEK